MKIHFIGVGGIGMSALAQLHAMGGDIVTGSDRLINKGMTDLPVFNALRKLGVVIFPQDGSGIDKDAQLVILSSAIEEDNPELLKAKELNIKIMHRSELLAAQIAKSRTIAVSGTSGKSTVTAMIFEILTAAGLSPSVIAGATLLSLQEKGFYGNVYKGAGDLLIIEADESDGSIVKYHTEIGVCLNIQKDHKELDILRGFFTTFAAQCKTFIYNGDEAGLPEIFPKYKSFSLKNARDIKMDGFGSSFTAYGQKFKLNIPGEHNIKNALAAITVCHELGADLKAASDALENFKGVYRRFNVIGKYNDIEVIDDFAHNPHKLAAAISAAQLRGKRVLSYFQPHAFASIKLLSTEFVEMLVNTLRPQDIFWLTEAYYPGGTIPEGITAKSVADGAAAKGLKNVIFNKCREDILKEIAAAAKPGDVIMVMGARDPSLTKFAGEILSAVKSAREKAACPACLLGNCCMNYNR